MFHNLGPQNAGLVDVKRDLKKIKGNFFRAQKTNRISIVINNMHTAERPSNYFFSNYFTHNQAK